VVDQIQPKKLIKRRVVYQPLRNAWDSYEVLGWSSWDFAVRFACLTLHDDSAKDSLRELRERIEIIRFAEAIAHEISEVQNPFLFVGLFGESSFIAGIPNVLLGVAGAALNVLNPWTALLWSGFQILGYLLGRTEPRFMILWRKRAKSIELRFPQLVGLINWEETRQGAS
jgi:hypothetical protein